MRREHFEYAETARVLKLLDQAAHRSGVSRAQAFEDFLHMAVCSLSGGRMEEQYLATVAKHAAGAKGERGVDAITAMFGQLIVAMERDTRSRMKDVLGDLFQGAITYGESQQFMTPLPICELMARLMMDAESSLERKSVCDPCCGSGRMLLAAAEINRRLEFIGQDVDLRCVRMTAINLALRNLYGHVLWGNTLAPEQKLIYRTGFDGRGFVFEVPLAACPVPVQTIAAEPAASPDAGDATEEGPPKTQQLRFF